MTASKLDGIDQYQKRRASAIMWLPLTMMMFSYFISKCICRVKIINRVWTISLSISVVTANIINCNHVITGDFYVYFSIEF